MGIRAKRVRWTCAYVVLLSFFGSAYAIDSPGGDEPNASVDSVRSQSGLDIPAPAGLALDTIGRSKVDVGLTIQGAWGTFINGKSYQQMPLDTFNNWQYATYYDQ